MDSVESAMKRVPAIKGLGQAEGPEFKLVAEHQAKKAEDKPIKAAISAKIVKAKKVAEDLKERATITLKDPHFQHVTVSTAGGALVLGTAGGAFGCASGVFVGSAAGLVPALFTLGLSIPAGAVVGGFTGLIVGASAGSGTGGAAGYGLYRYRVEIKDGVMYVKVKAVKTAEACNSHLNSHLKAGRARVLYLKDGASKKIQMSKERAKVKIDQATTFAKVTACDVFEGATSTRAGVTSTAAVAGGGVGFVAGGAVGAVAGATVGLVPALLTFGLSIPIGATIGLCAGVAAGGSAGVVGGGATGFTGFTYRKEIASSASYMRTKAIEKAVHVRQSVKSIIGSGTGGTV